MSDYAYSDTGDGGFSDSQRSLTVEFEVEFESDEGCPVVRDCCETAPIEHNLIDDVCHFTCRDPGDETAIHHRRAKVGGECVCRIVANHECNPSLQTVGEDRLVVRTHPPDRETLRSLIEDLRAVGEVRIRSLVADRGESASRSGLVSLQGLTGTERDTVERAIIEGYYDRPREIAFEALADKLGVTKSALSKRLASAEAKIMRDLFRDDS